jgi:hypothetical protein
MAGPAELTEIRADGIDYVVRTGPTGVMDSALPMLSFIALTFTTIRRWLRRDSTWTIAVRKRADDPLGPDVHQEVLQSREAASQRLPELLKEARAGHPAWRPDGGSAHHQA